MNDHTPPMRLPKGKLPALRDGDRLVCDSHAIVEHLQRQHGAQLPPKLRQPLQGADLALCRLFEEHLYFCALWGRWIDPAGFAVVAPVFFGALPRPVRPLLAALVRRKMRRALHGQGMGRHSPAEISAKACADLDATAQMLGERPFFGGDAPSLLDCTIHAFLANALFVEIDHPVRRHLQANAALVAYVHRMAALVGR